MSDADHRVENRAAKPPGRVLSNRTIGVCAGVLAVFATGLAWLLLTRLGDGTDASMTRLDAIRTVGTIVLGAGGAVALLLTARRQQTAERDLVEKRRELDLKERAQAHVEQVQRHAEKVAADTQAHQLRVAEATEADAAARRITELFDTAVGKLGSDKAAVRFGGLYALERLAGHAVDQQRTIVHVLCAYLRMPYLDPGDAPGPDTDESTRSRYQHRREEREVRLAAQRLLADHLRPDANNSGSTYWADTAIDLTGATLIDLHWNHCRIPDDARFNHVIFIGTAEFGHAIFTGRTWFGDATFTDSAWFNGATFTDDARFGDATFTGDATFDGATFAGSASFGGATFERDARFAETTFTGIAQFGERGGFTRWNEFLGGVGYATFAGTARFHRATFGGDTRFLRTIFTGDANFHSATFTGAAWFDTTAEVDLTRAKAKLSRPDADTHTGQWPQGWSVHPNSGEPTPLQDDTWGELVAKRPPLPPPRPTEMSDS